MASGVTTEWEDIQVHMGNWAPKEKGPTTEEVHQQTVEAVENIDEWKGKKVSQMERMVEDNPDLEDEDEFMQQYREKRLEEMKQEFGKPRFG